MKNKIEPNISRFNVIRVVAL